jgi:hypothetical protein
MSCDRRWEPDFSVEEMGCSVLPPGPRKPRLRQDGGNAFSQGPIQSFGNPELLWCVTNRVFLPDSGIN